MNEEAANTADPIAERKEAGWTNWLTSPVSGLMGLKHGENIDSGESETPEVNNEPKNSWLYEVGKKLPSFLFRHEEEPVDMNNLADYSHLSTKQIQFLELEAQQGIIKKADTWCWFEDFTTTSQEELAGPHSGELSVANTGSAVCPLPLVKFPVSRDSCHQFYVQNSLLLPNVLPNELFHERSTLNKVSAAWKNYYNFEGEKHTYLSHGTLHSRLGGKKAVIVSFVGGLPDKYEKATLGKQMSAKQLTTKLASAIKEFDIGKVVTFSMETPLDQKSLDTCCEECIGLLSTWHRYFHDADLLLFAGVYHSVPLQLQVAKHVLEHRNFFGFSDNATIGLLGLESCLGGYQFWDHSSDSKVDTSSANYQANREKALLQGCTRAQQETLSRINQYRDPNSSESKRVQSTLDWMFRHHPNTKLVLIGRLYDNFMTVAEKLAINLQHPSIIRHAWCEGSILGFDLKKCATFLNAGEQISKGPILYEETLEIPGDREFELCLVEDLLMAINLGHTQLIPMLKMVSPFFISRSFNKHTIPATLKKQQQYELKSWLQEMDMRWKNATLPKDGTIPAEIERANDLLAYVYYRANKPAPDRFKLKDGLFQNFQIFRTFLHDTMQTTALLEPQDVKLNARSITPTSILSSQNQYDLVWQIHDFLSYFAKVRNLPVLQTQRLLFSLSDQTYTLPLNQFDSVKFRRNKLEALRRIERFWDSYQLWKPPTKGLKQLQRILSFLSLYSSGHHLQVDLKRIQ
ncbi:LAME_0E05116g1_1 [Lachancea meyersii CBS 8951]|uniref:LAME_0E05116g1_1 n=1 Tax=Lachancea meyersii CBS 8951 TaxID=1266667 RepID=A0A1G4JHJ0_9SACH|nr:LAME_0E05116g1_1 [Lachancea meyersii CBS 8951]